MVKTIPIGSKVIITSFLKNISIRKLADIKTRIIANGTRKKVYLVSSYNNVGNVANNPRKIIEPKIYLIIENSPRRMKVKRNNKTSITAENIVKRGIVW
jgi:hypothetical protein